MTNLLDLTLRELLETWCRVDSPECGHCYGIAKWEDVGELENEFNLSNQASIDVNCLISDDIDLDKRLDIMALKKLCNSIGLDKNE